MNSFLGRMRKYLLVYLSSFATILGVALVFASALGWIRGSLAGPWSLELEMSSTASGDVTLLLDSGNGFNSSVSSTIPGDGGVHRIVLPLPPIPVRYLRLDPLDASGSAIIKSMTLVNTVQGERVPVSLEVLKPIYQISSATMRNGELVLVFPEGARDPQMSVDWVPLVSLADPGQFVWSEIASTLRRSWIVSLYWAFVPVFVAMVNRRSVTVPKSDGLIRRHLPVMLAIGVVALLLPNLVHYYESAHSKLRFRMRAPGAKIVQVGFGVEGSVDQRSTNVTVKPEPINQNWMFSVVNLPERNSLSAGNMAILLDVRTPEQQFSSWSQLTREGGWRPLLTPSRMGPGGEIGLGSGAGTFSGELKGTELQFTFLGSNRSGKLQLVVNGLSETVDLYSGLLQDMISLRYVNGAPGDLEWRQYEVSLPRTPINALKFTTKEGGLIEIQQLEGEGLLFTSTGLNSFLVDSNKREALAFALLVSFAMGALLWVFAQCLQKRNAEWATAGAPLSLGLFAAMFWGLLFYPGFMDKDSMMQWESALTGNYYNWHPPLLPFVMKASMFFCNGPSLLCFLGGMLYWSSMFIIVRLLVKSPILFALVCAVLVVNPILALYSISVTNSVWAVNAALFSTAALIVAIQRRSGWYFAVSVLLISIASCFRHNYPSVAIVHAVAGFFLFSSSGLIGRLKGAFLAAFVVVVATVPSKILSSLPFVSNQPYAMSIAVMNSYVGTLHSPNIPPRERKHFQRSFDRVLGKGAFDRLQSSYICEDYFTYFSHPEVLAQDLIVTNSAFIVRETAKVAWRYPRAFLDHKMCWARNFLHMDRISYKELIGVEFNPYGYYTDSRFPLFYNAFRDLLVKHELQFFYSFYLFFFVALIIGGLSLVFRQYFLALLLALSLGHFAGYAITDVSACWRYNLYSYILSWIMLLVSLVLSSRWIAIRIGTVLRGYWEPQSIPGGLKQTSTL